MDATIETMEKFIMAGEKMGLTGTDLRAFVTEHMDKARQERAAHRELERVKAEAKAEAAKAEAKAAIANTETEKQKMDAEATKAKLDAEATKAKLDAEATKAKLDAETQQKNLELEFQLKHHKQQLAHERELNKTKNGNTSRDLFTIPQAPNLPMFADGTDDMNSFLERFERVAIDWALMLLCCVLAHNCL